MKRVLFFITAILISSHCLGQSVTVDGITYKVKDGEAYASKMEKDVEVAIIRSEVTIDGKSYPVTAIGRKMLMSPVFKGERNLRSVSIPNSVKYIWDSAFMNCYNLTELIVPDKPLKTHHMYKPFPGCTSLLNVRCQNGSIPTYMFGYLPPDCPFMQAQRFQQVGNNNMYAQNVQQPVVPDNSNTSTSLQNKPSSDVDVNIPQVSDVQKNTFAIIIANEDYQDEVKVDYAMNDGEVFRDYCHKILGLPEMNVHFVPNATLNNLIGELDWLQQLCEKYKGDASVIFYYVGHGVPDEVSGSAYLLPTDGRSRLLRTCFSINELYEALGKLRAKQVTVVMDACFSGSQRNGGMLVSARGVAIKAKTGVPQGNMIVLSAAQGDETAYKYDEKGHGLFTYFLLKKLKDTKGNVTMGELSSYLQDEVGRHSIVVNSKSQTPCTTASPSLQNNWRNMKLK